VNSNDVDVMDEAYLKTTRDASKDDVLQFIEQTKFSGYQCIELPYGLKTPGMDRERSADLVFKYSVKNKSVLDVGCKYGYFCHEALKRGASKVTGVEISEENVKVARGVVVLWNRNIEIRNSDFMLIPDSETYDIVLFLNVMHHIISPVTAMRKLSEIAKELVIVEFPTIFDSHTKLSIIKKFIMKSFFSNDPFMFIGKKKYHRTWYFSKNAFINLFVKQMNIFMKIDFKKSPRKKGRLIAYCWK